MKVLYALLERLDKKRIERGTLEKEHHWSLLTRMVLHRNDGKVYLDRIRLLQTPRLRVFLHRMDAPDPGMDLHDHPWPFVSIILKGGYVEGIASTRTAHETAATWEQNRKMFPSRPPGQWLERRGPGRMHYMPLHRCHTITELIAREEVSWSLVIAWGLKQSWGFYTPAGYIPNDDYDYVVRRSVTVQGDGRGPRS